MSGVRETVLDTMAQETLLRQYADRAEPVIKALEIREVGIATSILAAAQAENISEGMVRSVLAEAGLTMPDEGGDADRTAQIDAMQDTINKLQGEIDSLRRR